RVGLYRGGLGAHRDGLRGPRNLKAAIGARPYTARHLDAVQEQSIETRRRARDLTCAPLQTTHFILARCVGVHSLRSSRGTVSRGYSAKPCQTLPPNIVM